MNKAFNRVIKKHIVLSILTVFAVVLMMGGITYALFVVEDKNTTNQKISVGNLDIELSSVSGPIILRDLYPENMADLDENENTYTYTISNTGEYPINYTIYLNDNTTNVLNSTTEYSSYSRVSTGLLKYINFRLDDETTAHNLLDVRSVQKLILFSGFLEPGISEEHSIQFWVDNGDTTTTGAPNTLIGKILAVNINMEGTIANTESYKTLTALGLEDSLQSVPTGYNMFDYTYQGYSRQNGTTLDEGVEVTEGLYSMVDDYGTSYYFRGSKLLNNIVQFGTYDEDMYYYSYPDPVTNRTHYYTGNLTQCNSEVHASYTSHCSSTNQYASSGDPMYWRIIRINGDGSLRMMYIGTAAEATGLNSYAGLSMHNIHAISITDSKYSGYTYDNTSPNAGDGTASSIKRYIDRWYESNLTDEDSMIATGQFFNDTSGYTFNQLWTNERVNDVNIYSTMSRLEKNYLGVTNKVKPTLKTTLTDQNYGGVYYLKAGLINVDELVLSGFDGIYGINSYDSTKESYPFTVNATQGMWSMSPAFYESNATNNQGAHIFYANTYGYISLTAQNSGLATNPVINLTAETARSLIGTGSTTDYYRLPE